MPSGARSHRGRSMGIDFEKWKRLPWLCRTRDVDRRKPARRECVLDGEIACLDETGRPNFRDLLFRQRQCIFIAFDLLYLNGKDLRVLPLIERKAMLKKLLRRKRSRILYLDHVEAAGRLLFEAFVKMDLAGIVCRPKGSPYKVTEKPSPHWIKIKNPKYPVRPGSGEWGCVLRLFRDGA